MDRYAIFVDAGYFFAAGAQAASGIKIPRKQVSLNSPQAIVEAICAEAAKSVGGIPLLRIYWYDAMPGPRMSLDQSALAMLAGVKLRLGALNSVGQQKGVDSLIVTDLIDLARNGAIADAVVIAGDDDLRVAFQVAQSFGVRVHILAAGDYTKNVSPSLQMEADSVASLEPAWLRGQLTLHTPAIPAPAAAHTGAAIAVLPPASAAPEAPAKTIAPAPKTKVPSLEDAATAVIPLILDNLSPEQIKQFAEYVTTHHSVPSDYDRPFIAKVSTMLEGRRLNGADLRQIRGIFITAVKTAAQ